MPGSPAGAGGAAAFGDVAKIAAQFGLQALDHRAQKKRDEEEAELQKELQRSALLARVTEAFAGRKGPLSRRRGL